MFGTDAILAMREGKRGRCHAVRERGMECAKEDDQWPSDPLKMSLCKLVAKKIFHDNSWSKGGENLMRRL